MSKTIHDLRKTLFDTLDDFRSGKVSAEQVKAVCEVGQVLINTAKVEVDHIKVVGTGVASDFLADHEDKHTESNLPPGIVSVRQHRIK